MRFLDVFREPPQPGAALFRDLRLRLTAWYSGVLVLALTGCGLVLYFGLQDLTLSPVTSLLRGFGELQMREWERSPASPRCGSPAIARPAPPNSRRPMNLLPLYMACISADGEVIGTIAGTAVPTEFLDTALLRSALRDGEASDVVDTEDEAGPIYRLALAVSDPGTGQRLGIVQVGRSVGLELETVKVVRDLLFLIAILALIGAVAGGLWLANRALLPARLAFTRQQAFIADASHQLRAPLTLLRAEAEVLLRHRDRFDPEDVELLEDIVAETAHMDQLATNLLSLARLDSQGPHLEHEAIDLAALSANVARRVATLADEKGLTVAEDYPARPRLLGDREALEQAALILVENAIKYTPRGGIVTLRTEAANGHAKLIVEDNGVGIPVEHLDRLGERFYRVDPARSSDTGGSGLGLAIAFRIAAAHGGTLHFISTPDHGTTATLSVTTNGVPTP